MSDLLHSDGEAGFGPRVTEARAWLSTADASAAPQVFAPTKSSRCSREKSCERRNKACETRPVH